MRGSVMKRVLASFACGLILTVILTGCGLSQDSRPALCVFIWQACLVQLVIHTPDNSIHEGSPIDLLGFASGVTQKRPYVVTSKPANEK